RSKAEQPSGLCATGFASAGMDAPLGALAKPVAHSTSDFPPTFVNPTRNLPRFDWAIDVRGEIPHAVLMWLSGAKRRIGWDCGGGGFLLTDRADYQSGRHEVDSRAELLRTMGIEPPEDFAPRFTPPDRARRRVAERLAQALASGRPLVAAHVGAGIPARRWPIKHWRETLRTIIDETDALIVTPGVASERGVLDRVARGLPSDRVLNWAGECDVCELAALLERADAFVGADSGPAHLASAVGTPSVVLFSGTNRPEQWRPRGADVRVLREPVSCSPCHCSACPLDEHLCMTRLQPSRVLDALLGVLGEHSRGRSSA
ncbi:MAG: glycosyltransferase family 9 protein, partial [Planctomycetales bacterium]